MEDIHWLKEGHSQKPSWPSRRPKQSAAHALLSADSNFPNCPLSTLSQSTFVESHVLVVFQDLRCLSNIYYCKQPLPKENGYLASTRACQFVPFFISYLPMWLGIRMMFTEFVTKIVLIAFLHNDALDENL